MPPLELDHLIYAAPTLEAGMEAIEQRLGMRPVYGGQHHGRGTHNALLGLGAACYLEVISPDPAQFMVPRPLWMGVDQVAAPGLIGWAVRTADLEAFHAEAQAAGWPVGVIAAGERETADGHLLRWCLTEPSTGLNDGGYPFAIDWGSMPHPAQRLPQAASRAQVMVQAPDTHSLNAVLGRMPHVAVRQGPRRLMAHLRRADGGGLTLA